MINSEVHHAPTRIHTTPEPLPLQAAALKKLTESETPYGISKRKNIHNR